MIKHFEQFGCRWPVASTSSCWLLHRITWRKWTLFYAEVILKPLIFSLRDLSLLKHFFHSARSGFGDTPSRISEPGSTYIRAPCRAPHHPRLGNLRYIAHPFQFLSPLIYNPGGWVIFNTETTHSLIHLAVFF